MTKTKFMEKYGDRLVKVHDNKPDGGDFILFHPEEEARARSLMRRGYEIHSIFEPLEKEGEDDRVTLDTAFIGNEHGKVGYFVLL